MPAQSPEQRRSAGVALAAKRGRFPVERLTGAAKQMHDTMDAAQLSAFARSAPRPSKGQSAPIYARKTGESSTS